ncbi:MAG: hypothetical protein DLM72_21100 [Candidatus Nitrosopolaris wilkensis]|nr:MAG: hypothetical protein DLM72_21100 [Candidatus Nitrosopolaris wilkensis]
MQRQETRGAWVKFPKAWYEALMILELRTLDTDQNEVLDNLWNQIHEKSLLPFRKMDVDDNRKLIDNTYCEILGIPTIDPLRTMLCDEPMMSG